MYFRDVLEKFVKVSLHPSEETDPIHFDDFLKSLFISNVVNFDLVNFMNSCQNIAIVNKTKNILNLERLLF